MYRFKWPVKFSLPLINLSKLFKTVKNARPTTIMQKTSRSVMVFAALIIMLLVVNGAFWYFRATHREVSPQGEQAPELEKWQVNLNENRMDEEDLKKEYNLPSSKSTPEVAEKQTGESSRTDKEKTQKSQATQTNAVDKGQAVQTNLSEKSYKNSSESNAVPAANQLALATMAMPVTGRVITDYAVDRLIYSKTLEQWNAHYGIDIAAEEGSPVKAVMEGTVVEVRESDPRLGVVVVIDHGGDIRTLYGNLSPNPMVQKGKSVKKGQIIGAVGKTAPYEIEDPPHLHFEVLKGGENIDPQQYIPRID
ncbi:MAG: hypothetical protein PWQ97_963 [Tepidanaerobacteraceae bacterium]|nr:hypothetical protein [Tepidanaerobacteraceae bacterium]